VNLSGSPCCGAQIANTTPRTRPHEREHEREDEHEHEREDERFFVTRHLPHSRGDDFSDRGDATSQYTSALVEAYERAHGDCGGGWLIYWGQSMPGLGNAAVGTDGRPMKNWWPFLFY